ncbi:MAG: thioredoxin family protein [Armatimonadota bacterium]|nr:thioredoxin family protein [Armatimonadota bacterium]
MPRRVYTLIAVTAAALLLASCQSPAVQKKATDTKSSAAVQTKAKSKSSGKSAAKAKTSKQQSKSTAKNKTTASSTSSKTKSTKQPAKPAAKQLPRLLDLGATKCVPCKMMAPILEELAREYKGKLKVEFIDVWENPDAARKYGIRVIPTQIFFDEKGEEFFRHEGFYSKEDILRKFRDQGIDLDKPSKER